MTFDKNQCYLICLLVQGRKRPTLNIYYLEYMKYTFNKFPSLEGLSSVLSNGLSVAIETAFP